MTPKSDNHIAHRLRVARTTAGYLTAREFALKNDLNIPTYQQHESGRREARAVTLEKYASLLNISLVWLITGKNKEDTPTLFNQEIITLHSGPFTKTSLVAIFSQLFDERDNLSNQTIFCDSRYTLHELTTIIGSPSIIAMLTIESKEGFKKKILLTAIPDNPI